MKLVSSLARGAVLAGALVFLIVVILIATGHSPGAPLRAGVAESLGSWAATCDTLALALPLVTISLGTGLAFRSGMFNLGGEGQLVAGGLAAAVVGTGISNSPTVLHVGLALGAGAVAGLVPAAVLGIMRVRLGVDEVLSTLMSNFLLVLLAQYLVTHQLRDPARQTGTTRNIGVTARFGQILGSSRLTWAVGFVLVLAVATWWVVERSKIGYAAKMIGISPQFGTAVGLPVGSLHVQCMAASGAYAGLAGAVVVTASQFRFWGGVGGGLGFTAVLIALLAANRPIATVAWSLLYTVLTSSARGMELESGVPSEVTAVALSLVLLLFASKDGLVGAPLWRRLTSGAKHPPASKRRAPFVQQVPPFGEEIRS